MDKKYKRMIKVMSEREESSKKRRAGFLRASGFLQPFRVRRPKGCIPVGQSSTELRAGFLQSSTELRAGFLQSSTELRAGFLQSSTELRAKESWFLYILKCNDGSLYTGIAKNLARRLKMHNDGKASRYTRTRRPVELVYQENCGTHAQALVRECKIKTFSKEKKQELIGG